MDDITAGPGAMRHLVLVGLMGSGKSSVGRAVAARRGVGFVDTDAEVERRAGATVAELFAARGEPGFRDLEQQVVADLLDAHDPTVIATGGGAVLREATRARMAGHCVVWLDADAGELARRTAGTGERPLLAGAHDDERRARLAVLAAERGPHYAEVAAHRVATDGREVADLADQVAGLWTAHAGRGGAVGG